MIEYRNNWGEDRVYYLDDSGELRSILASCTDAGGVDPFVAMAEGRSFFRYDDLLRLTRLLDSLQGKGQADV